MRSRVQVSLPLLKLRSGFATPFFVAGETVCYLSPKPPFCKGGLYSRYTKPPCKFHYSFVILQKRVRDFDTLYFSISGLFQVVEAMRYLFRLISSIHCTTKNKRSITPLTNILCSVGPIFLQSSEYSVSASKLQPS